MNFFPKYNLITFLTFHITTVTRYMFQRSNMWIFYEHTELATFALWEVLPCEHKKVSNKMLHAVSIELWTSVIPISWLSKLAFAS